MYAKVTMNVDDEDVRLINDEGSPTHLETHLCIIFTSIGPLYSDNDDDIPLDIDS